MKLVLCFIAIVVGVTTAATLRVDPAAVAPHKKPIKFIAQAITSLQEQAITARTSQQQATATCKLELNSLSEDDRTVSDEKKADDAEDREERLGHKVALQAAVGNRVQGMMKMMNKLGALREKLHAHIDRVNKIFTAKFKADNADIQSAQSVLGNLKSHIMADNAETAPITDTGFLQMTTANAPSCDGASKAAYMMFNESHANHEKMLEYFNLEREKLGKVKMALDAVMSKKQAKVLALSRQNEELKSVLNSANATSISSAPVSVLGELVAKSIGQHEEVIRQSCATIANEGPEMVQKRRHVYTELKQCKVEAGYLEDGISEDEEFVRSKRPDMNWDALVKSMEGDLEGKTDCSNVLNILGSGNDGVITDASCNEIGERGRVSRFKLFKYVAGKLKSTFQPSSDNSTKTAVAPQASSKVFTLSEISV